MARTKLPPNDLYIGDVKVINYDGTFVNPVETPQDFAVEQKTVSIADIRVVNAELEFTSTGGVDNNKFGAAVSGTVILSAKTSDGEYAALEGTLDLPTGAKTGDALALLKLNVTGADASEFDDDGFIFAIDGVTISDDKAAAVQEAEVEAVGSTHALRIAINGTAYYIPMHTAVNFVTEV